MAGHPVSERRDLSLVLRSGDGREVRHLLDVTEAHAAGEEVRAAERAARDGTTLRLGGDELPVFDLRTPVADALAADGVSGDGAAPRGSIMIGRRGAMRVALLVD